jgi:hypothetical protein
VVLSIVIGVVQARIIARRDPVAYDTLTDSISL